MNSGSMYDKNSKENCWPHYLEKSVKERFGNESMPGSGQKVLVFKFLDVTGAACPKSYRQRTSNHT